MQQSGIIKLIILIVIALVVLGYFGINLKAVMESDTVQDNLSYVWNGTKSTWHNYLAEPSRFVWGIFYNYLWLSFIENMERLKEGRGPTFFENTPGIETQQ